MSQWETPKHLSHNEQLFIMGLHRDIAMEFGDGDVTRYKKLIDLGLVGFQRYTYNNQWVFLTWRGKQIARQLLRNVDQRTKYAADAFVFKERYRMINGISFA